MFWDNYYNLCLNNGISPNAAAKEMKISSGAVTEWKKGRVPQMATVKKIADYFKVTADDLLGTPTDQQNAQAPTLKPKTGIAFYLTAHEADILTAYRDQPEMQPAVDRILGVTDDNHVLIYEAAKSADNHPPQIVKRTKEDWNALKNAPETDEDLL